MKQALYDRNSTLRVLLLPLVLLAFYALTKLAFLAMGHLGEGKNGDYVIEKQNNEVTYVTSDEGRGTVRMVITNADAATFEVLNLSGPGDFARDKNHVYLYGTVVRGAHPESFQRFRIPGEVHGFRGPNFYYYRDSERVFIYPYSLNLFIAMLDDSDPESFRVITNSLGWARDRTRVYQLADGFVPRDIDSFEPLERLWSRDSQAYYWGRREVAGADRSSFQISEQHPWFASDRNHLFWSGWVIDRCDPQTFHITGNSSGYDNHFTYQFNLVWETNVDLDFQKLNVQRQPN
jgi:hypothetical protein